MKKKIRHNIFLFVTDYHTTTSEWQGAPYFRRYGRELALKPSITVQEKLGGYRRLTRECFFSLVFCFAMNVVRFEVRCREHRRKCCGGGIAPKSLLY